MFVKKVIACSLVVLCFATSMMLTCYAKGNWSAQTTLDIPPRNQEANTKDLKNPVHVVKSSTDSKCSVKVYSNLAGTKPDGRLINANHKARSNWIQNLDDGYLLHGETTASLGYYYYFEISSDLLQFTEKSISFKFSADNNTTD